MSQWNKANKVFKPRRPVLMSQSFVVGPFCVTIVWDIGRRRSDLQRPSTVCATSFEMQHMILSERMHAWKESLVNQLHKLTCCNFHALKTYLKRLSESREWVCQELCASCKGSTRVAGSTFILKSDVSLEGLTSVPVTIHVIAQNLLKMSVVVFLRSIS